MNTYNRRNITLWAVLLVISIALISCAKNNDDFSEGEAVTKDYIVVEEDPSFSANTTSYLLNVQFNCNWTMAASGNWDGLSFDRTSGEGSGKPESVNIVVTTSKNDQPDDRSCQLVFSNSDGSFKRTITLTQTAGDFKVELDVDPTQINVIASGETKDFKVECNTVWTVSVNTEASWCVPNKVNGTKNETVNLTIQPNQTPNPREAHVTVSAGNRQSNKKEFVITVAQDAATLPAPVVTEVVVGDDLKSIVCKATFNSMYDVTEYGYYIICNDISLNEKHQVGTNGSTKGDFSFTITDNIEDGREYIIRAYAISVVGEGVSQDYPVTVTGDVPGNNDNPSPNLTRKK